MVPISRSGLGGLQKVLERMLQADSSRTRDLSCLPLPGAVNVSLPVVTDPVDRAVLVLLCRPRGLAGLVFDGHFGLVLRCAVRASGLGCVWASSSAG